MTKYISLSIMLLILTTLSAQAEEVLVVTWRGKTDAEAGFETQLKKLRPNVKFKYLDAKRDKGQLASSLRHFDYSNINLIYTFGTTASKMIKQYNVGKIPQVFNIVSYPIKTKIASSIDKPGSNLTGVSHLVNIETQFEILSKLKKIETIGVWFDPREKNTVATVDSLKRWATKTGKTLKTFRIIVDAKAASKDIIKASKAAKGLDVLYIPASSAYIQKADMLFSKLDKSVFVFGAISKYIGKGATVALSVDYHERGVKAAELANSILSGSQAGILPVEVVSIEDTKLYVDSSKIGNINLDPIKSRGIKIEKK